MKEIPTKENITDFWSGIWSNRKTYNHESQWLNTLEEEYCKNVTTKEYVVTSEVFKKVLNRMKNNGAPGTDQIRCFWIKKLTSTHEAMVTEFKKVYNQGDILPNWLVTGRTILLPKNSETKIAKNYRPIACQNITYKLFTGMLNSFVVEHCVENDIITLEQAGGKPGSWGCTDQLLINIMILDEVREHRRNLCMMWFDYKKAFDSVPHDWILKALELARVPPLVIQAIKNLMGVWATKLYLKDIITDTIKYLTGFLQGDCLSLVMFILSVNPLSFLLKRLPGYIAGPAGSRNTKINHLFFVDDLKTYAHDTKEAKLQLDLVSTFTDDIGMEFGTDKCAYICIERGKQVTRGNKFSINNIELNELHIGDKYKYLGQEESVSYDQDINKEKVTKEYYKRVRKIWSSELYANNKGNAHNIFAIPVITPTFGILDWTKEELLAIDVKTRKILTTTGSFHLNSDVDRLYCNRTKGGRGLNSLVDIYISRILSVGQHLRECAMSNVFLADVLKHEQNNLIRIANELATCYGINTDQVESPKKLSADIRQKLKDDHLDKWKKKPQHGFLNRTRETVSNVNEKYTNA